MEIIKTIDRLSYELKNLLPLKIELQQKLEKKFRLEFNYNSNHIEGNTLTYGETELLLMFDKTTGKHELRELEEMKAHDVAFETIKDWAKDDERPLNETAIKNLNGILLVRQFWKDAMTPDGQSTRRLIRVGDYEEYPNSVRLQNGEMFHYASPEETSMLMGDLVEWYRSEEEKKLIHPVDLAAQLHYKFVRIHPFDDGNGRISRLLMNYVLLKNHLPPIIIKSAKKKDYLFALNQADSGDLEAFTKYIAEQLCWSLELSIKAAQGYSLEEEDDLEKEIAIWKKSLIEQPDALPKDNNLIFERYNDSIRPLFVSFIEKHFQFAELFNKSSVVVFPTMKQGYLDLESLDEAFSDYRLQHEKWLKEEGEDEVTIDEIMIEYRFFEFKKSGTNAFSHSTFITCKFQQFEWVITANNNSIKKLYSQPVLVNEIKDFIKNIVKETFEKIQKNMTTE